MFIFCSYEPHAIFFTSREGVSANCSTTNVDPKRSLGFHEGGPSLRTYLNDLGRAKVDAPPPLAPP